MLGKLKDIAVAIGVNSFQEETFPIHDSFHADCTMITTFQATCPEVFDSIKTTIATFQDQANGTYKTKQAVADKADGTGAYVWATRTTPTLHYTDDIEFAIATNPSMPQGVCNVFARSRSQTISYEDADTNYCNMWNVFRSQNIKFAPPVTNECQAF